MQNNSDSLGVVALIGRPNVGKSSVFNALIKQKKAVVFDEPGTTRDPVTAIAGDKYNYFLVDTAGLDAGKSEVSLEQDMQSQTRLAIAEADIVVFMVDAKEGITAADQEVMDILRKSSIPCIFVANKAEGQKIDLMQFAEFGLDVPMGISALQREGIRSLEDEIYTELEKTGHAHKITKNKDDSVTKLVFAGRPNVGKSSFINAFLNSNKCIVSDVPGTTRDSVEVPFSYEDEDYILFDTAGVRRHAKRASMIEHFATMRTLECLHRADVALLLLNAEDGPTTQDARIAEELVRAGITVVIVLNKIDLVEGLSEERSKIEFDLRRQFKFLAWAPVVFASAKTKKNIFVCLDLAREVAMKAKQNFDEERLQHVFMGIVTKRPHSTFRGRAFRFRKIRQVKEARLPVFQIECSDPEHVHFSYKRYLQNNLREKFDLTGVPIRLEFLKKIV